MVLIMFTGYLLPSEFLGKVKDVIKPSLFGGPALKFWAIRLHPEEGQQPSKTVVSDECVSFGLEDLRWLGERLGLWAQSRSRNASLFDLALEKLRSQFAIASFKAGVVHLEADL